MSGYKFSTVDIVKPLKSASGPGCSVSSDILVGSGDEEMASSLAELLQEDGFKGRRSRMKARASFKAEAAASSRMRGERQRMDHIPAGSRIRTERANSDMNRYNSRGGGESSGSSDAGTSSRNPRAGDYVASRFKNDEEEGNWDRIHRRSNKPTSHETVEVGKKEDDDDGRIKDIYSDMVKYAASSSSHGSGNSSYGNGIRARKDNEADRRRRRRPAENVTPPQVAGFALDEVAIQAMVSILNGYSRRFFKDDEFRTMARYNCFSSFNFNEIEEIDSIERKVISSLEEAVDTVEKAAAKDKEEEDFVSAKDLKRAALQLSVITGFNSNELKDGYTFGVPNSRLSACAHFYLSVVYKLQKNKDRISAKHLLQVFCDSPFWARTVLLPDLWEYLLFPHLSHLKSWYNKEAESLPCTPSKIRKVKLLDKVYNETLDSGTYQFAVYYKDWLTEGLEAPSVPSIHVPSLSSQSLSSQGGSKDHSPRIYDAINSSKLGHSEAGESGDHGGSSVKSARSSDDSGVQVKEALTTTFYSERGKDVKSLCGQEPLAAPQEEWKLAGAREEQETDSNGGMFSSQEWHDASTRGTAHVLNASPQSKATNELRLKGLLQSVSGVQRFNEASDLTVMSPRAGYELDCEYFEEGSFYASIPQDFICPLTGELFEDPVTLETGQTFEREAIAEWFDQQGNCACPVTGKSLECVNLPLTNLILKRIIHNWKLEHCGQLLALASEIIRTSRECETRQRDETATFILEKLLTTFNVEERVKNAIHLVCLGGLEFLIRRFALGNVEEKSRVALLLSCCIEADSDSRSLIGRNIDQQCLVDLLHSKQPDSRRNAVSLFTELVCLSRYLYSSLSLGSSKFVFCGSQLEQKPSIAVLLLHLDLLVAPQNYYSIYREEAVDAIAVALEGSLIDDKVRESTCKALLMLGGRFSAAGGQSSFIKNWVLKQAGHNANTTSGVINSQGATCFDDSFSQEEEEEEEEAAGEEWLRNLSALLLSNGKKSFLDSISQCLNSGGKADLVTVCLSTIVWLSCALSSESDAEFQLPAFSALISGLKDNLENGELDEHKVLASMSLLNFSRIPECRVMLSTIAEDITGSLRSLFDVTWAAKQLHSTISG
ncbi:unnamed protein product [Linum tenue]|uniref:RING-type E3 ubiquitin transferase n=1 Tax=Linum tenue TaxID=586396 RepID=A0AAV0M1K3_9ROSI|nr:unnamed protein product [Linum tenue]